jgi:hypothetical protein
MKKDLTILKVKQHNNNNKRFDNLDDRLLKPPFLLICQGSVKSGKSNFLMNIIYNDNMYHKVFDQVIYISPTIHQDPILEKLREDDEIIKLDNPEDLDNILKKIVKSQEEPENKDDHLLIIIDDSLGYIKPGNSYLNFLSTRYRHYRLSLLITSQDFRSIPNKIRQNATGYIFWKCNNRKELNKIIEEFAGLFENFEEHYKEATDNSFNFLFMNLRDLSLNHNFDKLLYIKQLRIEYKPDIDNKIK